ncbi:MAG: DUF2812 domain-containing protein [Bacillota bacterium]|nr:DUF2812 domain-containing protein [Bacillota bacterium]
MRVLKCFINFDKEEKWLNEMAQKGYELEKAGFGYKFHAAEPEDAVIRIDYRTFNSQKNFVDYCTLFEDSGWKHVAGSKWSGTQYFKKIAVDGGEDDIFSDVGSKAGKYKRLSNTWMVLAIAYMPLFSMLISEGKFKVLVNPKLLYLSPGLWNDTGAVFWGRFLFETPFAIMRGFPCLFFPFAIILYLYFAFKAKALYYKQIKAN